MPILTQEEQNKLNYQGEFTLEALATLDTYTKWCCNSSATARKLNKGYEKVRGLLKHPYVRDLFKLKLMQKGVTPDRIAEKVLEGLEANHGIYYEGRKVADEPDWSARHRFTQLAAEIFEVLKYNYKVDVSQVNNQLNISVNDGERLVREARARNIPIPEVLARRYLPADGAGTVGSPDAPDSFHPDR